MPTLKNYKYDKNKEEEGVWFTTTEGLKLKIARVGNAKATRMMRRLGVENRNRLRRTNETSGDLVDDLSKQVASKHILIDWDDILEDDEVTKILYSSEKALELFREYNEFFMEVMEYAGQDESFRMEEVEEASKN